MNKEKLKKLALLGISGGVLLTGTQVSAFEGVSESSSAHTVARAGCGASKCGSNTRNGCGSRTGNGGGCGSKQQSRNAAQQKQVAEYDVPEEIKYKKPQDPTEDVTQPKKQPAAKNAEHGCGAKGKLKDKQIGMQDQRNQAFQGKSAIDENSFGDLLDSETLVIYQGFDAEGRALSMRYASESNFKNPNEAVKRAADEIAKKKSELSLRGQYLSPKRR
jgi:hypothetical protein